MNKYNQYRADDINELIVALRHLSEVQGFRNAKVRAFPRGILVCDANNEGTIQVPVFIRPEEDIYGC